MRISLPLPSPRSPLPPPPKKKKKKKKMQLKFIDIYTKMPTKTDLSLFSLSFQNDWFLIRSTFVDTFSDPCTPQISCCFSFFDTFPDPCTPQISCCFSFFDTFPDPCTPQISCCFRFSAVCCLSWFCKRSSKNIALDCEKNSWNFCVILVTEPPYYHI